VTGITLLEYTAIRLVYWNFRKTGEMACEVFETELESPKRRGIRACRDIKFSERVCFWHGKQVEFKDAKNHSRLLDTGDGKTFIEGYDHKNITNPNGIAQLMNDGACFEFPLDLKDSEFEIIQRWRYLLVEYIKKSNAATNVFRSGVYFYALVPIKKGEELFIHKGYLHYTDMYEFSKQGFNEIIISIGEGLVREFLDFAEKKRLGNKKFIKISRSKDMFKKNRQIALMMKEFWTSYENKTKKGNEIMKTNPGMFLIR
jgi:hypothetical protein